MDVRPPKKSTPREVSSVSRPSAGAPKTETDTTFAEDFPGAKPDVVTPERPKLAAHASGGGLGRMVTWVKTHKKVAVPLLIVFVLAATGAVAFALGVFKKDPVPTSSEPVVEQKAEEPPKPTTVASPLTGVQVAPELAARAVIAIMIENSTDARPQSGLHKAGVIFEAIAEGGITRFVTLFQEGQPDYIGPIRSVRPYYVDWAAGFDAPITHVGGSVDGKARVAEYGKDLDQFVAGKYFERIKERFAPHNVYSSMGKLDAYMRDKGYTSSSFKSWERKDDKPATTVTAKTVNLNVSSYTYNPSYTYDAPCNCYRRKQAGENHIDERSKEQLSPKVVVAIVVPSSIVNTADGKRYDYDAIGSGTAMVFQDGEQMKGKWTKPSLKENIVFTDDLGTPIKLNTGQVWVTAVTGIDKVSFAP